MLASALLLVLLCAGCHLPAPASAARILGLFPYKGASHFYVFQPLLEQLARRGHAVDVVSHLPRKEPLLNYTDISVLDEDNFPTKEFAEFSMFEDLKAGFFISNLLGLLHLTEVYEEVFARPEVQALANASYDLVITEMFNSDIVFGLTYRIGAPVIGFSSCQLMSWTEDSLAVPGDLPYVPLTVGGHGPNMGFFERLINTVELWISRAFYRFVIHSRAQALAEKYLGPLPDLADIAANTSLLFVNGNFVLHGFRPRPQNVIEVGGLNVRPPKPLPEELEQIFKKSKGIIYFSMGSVLKGSSLPPEKQKMFINALESTGRTVLWKREEGLTTRHPNIITRPWFPQRDILAHPKTELFIAHCGLLGVHEAVISGVPILCIPMFGDQPHNARHVEYSGIGLQLDYFSLNEKHLSSAVNDLLNNKMYKTRAREMSAAFRDRAMTPMEEAVFWVEYLLKHGPKPFMSPARALSLWQRLGLDIAAVLLAVSLILTVFFFLAMRKLFFRRKKMIKEKQN